MRRARRPAPHRNDPGHKKRNARPAWTLVLARRASLFTSQPGLDLFDLEGLDDVVRLDVAVVRERDTALEALGDFLRVVLEAAQARDFAGPDHDAVADEAGLSGATDH